MPSIGISKKILINDFLTISPSFSLSLLTAKFSNTNFQYNETKKGFGTFTKLNVDFPNANYGLFVSYNLIRLSFEPDQFYVIDVPFNNNIEYFSFGLYINL